MLKKLTLIGKVFFFILILTMVFFIIQSIVYLFYIPVEEVADKIISAAKICVPFVIICGIVVTTQEKSNKGDK